MGGDLLPDQSERLSHDGQHQPPHDEPWQAREARAFGGAATCGCAVQLRARVDIESDTARNFLGRRDAERQLVLLEHVGK